MSAFTIPNRLSLKPFAIISALLFLYWSVLSKLVLDWSSDNNYSHGLLVPFIIAYIVWQRFELLRSSVGRPNLSAAMILIAAAAAMLLGGTLASVLVMQRLSLVVMVAGVIVFFFGLPVMKRLVVPFVLLLLAIPIPQIIFNKIAFPLQLLASKTAGAGLSAIGLPIARSGNLIDIPVRGTGEIVSLEVVEACSGIRSLMTLITLAVILGYFTRNRSASGPGGSVGRSNAGDKLRIALLMICAVPVALLTNAARLMLTGILAHYHGLETVAGLWHDVSGAVTFAAAFLLLLGANSLLKWILGSPEERSFKALPVKETFAVARLASPAGTVVLFAVILFLGVFVNWLQYRGEAAVVRRPLKEIPGRLGTWEQRNEDIRFDRETELVLKASDYVMRDYYGPGKRINLYIGYYSSQRGGSTYHSPLSCLPGTGWEMVEPGLMEILTPSGKRFSVNRYTVRQGEHSEYLIYWYQGRGRTFVSEYTDKLYTSLDSVMRRRSDGGMVRIMTPIGKDPQRSLAAAIDLTSHVAENITEFLPD